VSPADDVVTDEPADDVVMDGHTTAVTLLFSTEPTDRALQGWHPPAWLALGTNAIYRKEWAELARWAPCGYTWDWYKAVTGPPPGGSELRPRDEP
jgi:hypothetical protein